MEEDEATASRELAKEREAVLQAALKRQEQEEKEEKERQREAAAARKLEAQRKAKESAAAAEAERKKRKDAAARASSPPTFVLVYFEFGRLIDHLFLGRRVFVILLLLRLPTLHLVSPFLL